MYNHGKMWRRHVFEMADRVNRIDCDLVVEVGAGDGEFLDMIEHPKMAYEPSDDAAKIDALGISVVKGYFDPNQRLEDGTLVVMRHLLEHIHSPTSFLDDIRATARKYDYHVELFIEVPNATNALIDCRIEDWTYEHPNHFTRGSLHRCLHLSGWQAESLFPTYGGEVLVAHAIPGHTVLNTDRACERFDKLRIDINEFRKHGPYVFWGGAGKSTMFLQAMAQEGDRVVDSDPRKWGKFVPGMPLRIVAPNIKDTDTVVITTNWREQDILAEIRARGMKPRAVYTYKNGALHDSKV